MTSPSLIEGSCFCGAVTYQAGPLLTPIGYCHCRTCQKTHAAVAAPTARIARSGFVWTKGGDHVAQIESTPGKLRHFCPSCGTHLMAEWKDQDQLILRIGSVDTPMPEKAVAHIWMSHEASWAETCDSLPKFTEGVGSPPYEPSTDIEN